MLEKIIEESGITKDDFVLEIGPGIGTMTQYLCENAREVAAVEIDKKIFVKGRVSEEEERPSKLICETIIPFEQTKKSCGCSFQIKKISAK